MCSASSMTLYLSDAEILLRACTIGVTVWSCLCLWSCHVHFSRCANKHAIFFPHFVWCMHVSQVVIPGSIICNVTFLVTCFTCLANSWSFFFYFSHLLQHDSFCSVSFNFVFVPDRQHSLNFSLVQLCFS